MELVILLVKIVVVFNLIMGLASLCTWIERKGSALIQDRVGANRAGSYFETDNLFLKPIFFVVRALGILGVINTLLCDGVKAVLKEDFVPAGTSKFIHALAPFIAVFPVFLAFAVVPLAPDFAVGSYLIRPQIVASYNPVTESWESLNAGILFLFAMGSIAVYGVALAGYTSNNKFAVLGGLRAAAQMISYELAMGLALISMIMLYGTLDLYEMVAAQKGLLWGVLPNWGVFYQPLGFLILFAVGMAETKRGPFDLPEAESELVAGYFTEYSGMKFLLFWLGEFAEIALFALLLSLLFFGGWEIPYLELPKHTWWGALIGHGVLVGKVVFFCVLQIVIRWTLPRFRFDQLMTLGWKILLPLSLVNLLLTGAAILIRG